MISYDKEPQYFTHKAILVEHGNQKAWIDTLLAPIILSCWKQGILTVHCCQESEPGVSFISFIDGFYLEKFLHPISSLTLDRTDFDRINQALGKWEEWLVVDRQLGMVKKRHLVRSGWDLGYKRMDLPVWTKNSDIQFPMSYIPAFEKALSA